MNLPLLPPAPVGFPDPQQTLEGGLLAAGGDLTPEWLLTAYAHGIFPWFGEDDTHILWWCPPERAVIEPGRMKVSRSLRKTLRRGHFTFSADTAFSDVMRACAGPRAGSHGTWITPEMRVAYDQMHALGFAHSIEVHAEGELVGGLYGISLGPFFFGESMFSRVSDASKAAFFVLNTLLERWSFELIDCQLMNPHLESLGVRALPRRDFLERLDGLTLAQTRRGAWQLPEPLVTLSS